MANASKGEAVAESDLIKDVKDDDDLDMSTLGKPVSSLAKPTASATSAVQQPTTPDQADGPPTKSKASKSGKSGKSNAGDNIWSQLDKEIEDVSEDDLDNLTPEKITAEAPGSPTKDEKAGADKPKETKRGIMPGGLSGGASLGANAPLKEGPKDHSYEIVDGEAKARVYDTPELRAAFLHYCKSSIKVSEMHLVHEGPFMAAQQFVQLCKDYKLLEPEGKLSFVMVGIIYTTSKSDDDEGLAFGQFLDSMVSLAFECECNVAGTLQAEWDKKDVLGKNSAAAQQQHQARRVRPTNLRALSTPGTDGDQSGALTPGTHGSVTPGGASTPGGGAGDPGALLQRSASRFHELVDQEGGAPVVRRKDPKKRFQGVETMTHSSVLDKVNEVSKIRSKATSRATSVINSRVASRMVSRLPSRRASEYGSEEEDEEDDFFDKEGLPLSTGGAPLSPSHKLAAGAGAAKGGKPPAVPPAAAAAYTISPSFLSTHVHAALQGYDGYDDDDPNGQRSSVPNVQGPNGETVSPLFAVASNIPQSPAGTTRARTSHSGAAPGLRPTTASNRGRMGSVTGASPAGPASAEGIKTLPTNLVNKGFGEEGGAAAADDEQQRASGEHGTPSKAKPPTHPGVVAAQQQQAAGGRGARVSSGGSGAGGAASGGSEGALPTKSSLKSALRDSGNKGLNKTSSSEGGAFGSPAGSFRARFSDAGDPAAAAAAAAAAAEPPVEQVLLAPGLSKQVNTQLWSQWTAQGGQGTPPKEWVDANVTKYTDGSAAAGATSLNNVSRSINTQGGAVSITAARQIKGAVAAASAAATGRRDSATGEGHPAGGDRQLSPYELQLAKLEAKYKRGGGAAAAAPAAAEGGPSRDQSPSRAGSARQSQSGSQPIWRPAGKDGPLSGSGKIKVDPSIARVASGRGGRASSSGGVGDSALSPTSPAPAAGDPALVLKSMLLSAATASDNGAAMPELPDSPTDHLHHLPTGEMLSPAKGRIARNAAANAAAAAAGGRPPVAISEDQLAMMASFGQGVVGNAAAEAAAAAADALEEEQRLKQQEGEAAAAAAGAGGEDKFSFAQKRRAEMEAKLAQIEQRLGGKAGELAPKPKPPSGPPPGGAAGSPRSSAATLAAVRPKPPSAAVAQ